MIKYENQCVDCGLPCIGNTCKFKKVPVRYCDMCQVKEASYEIDGEDLCSSCAQDTIKRIFDDMTLHEKAEARSVHLIDWR